MSDKLSHFAHRVQGKIRQLRTIAALRKEYRAIFRKNPNTVFLVMTPKHGNLGDHAIAYAEQRILERLKLHWIEISSAELSEMRWAGLLGAMNGYPILVNGGGNLGTLWFDVEELFRKLIEKNPRSPIFLLPNTIFYEDSEWGRKAFNDSVRLYNSHKDLHLYAREKTSYEIMENAYNDVTLMPDMVLSLNECRQHLSRRGCLICLRNDRERTRSENQDTLIRRQAAALFGNDVADTDTVVPGHISPEQREQALAAKFDEFAQAELVITDRLHGMIFCAITGTPCIVVNSRSPKVRGCYEWIHHLDYIRFVDDPADLAAEYAKIPKTAHVYDNSSLLHYYDALSNILNDMPCFDKTRE